MTVADMPIIDSPWILAMVTCGTIGFLLHVLFVILTVKHYFSDALFEGKKGRMFIFGCLLLLCFNMMACLLWAIARTNLIIPLSRTACQAIYASNFLCYFFGKYVLHILLIFRIYMTFRGSTLAMSPKSMMTFIIIVSLNFFIAVATWTYCIAPNVLQGKWIVHDSEFQICTLFSEQAHQNLTVKLAAITVGLEDFIVGGITFFVFLRRFRQIAYEAGDVELLESSTRFGVAAFFSVISTLFLFTLAIPFYPNMTFVLAVDATINSLCLFCVLSVGQELYYYVCAPCRMCGNRWLDVRRLHPKSSATELVRYFLNASSTELRMDKSTSQMNRVVITTAGGLTAILGSKPPTPVTPSLHTLDLPAQRLDPVASLVLMGTRSMPGFGHGLNSNSMNNYWLEGSGEPKQEQTMHPPPKPSLEDRKQSKSEPVMMSDVQLQTRHKPAINNQSFDLGI